MKILILGTGTTGKSVYKYLKSKNKDVFIYDEKSNYEGFLEEDIFRFNFDEVSFAVKSPGIKPESEIIKTLLSKNIEIISDVELFYRLYKKDNIVAITGTNGKTTTTTLVNEILKNVGTSCAIGNIGLGVMDVIDQNREFVVMELSSFELEYTTSFHPHIAVITNITSDHLDWHKTVENYRKAKEKIYKNQDENDFLILSYSDSYLRSLNPKNKNIYYYSYDDHKKNGAFVRDGKIFFRDRDGKEEFLMDEEKIFIKGRHNIENAMAAILCAKFLNVPKSIIVKTVENFKGCKDRIEFVREIDGISYYNDSKGTNPDSTDVALKAFKKSVLIIGGYDKKSEFRDLLKNNIELITSLVILGETKDKIKKEAISLNIPYRVVANMEEAVKISTEIAKENNSTVLLSPACASWDMYPNYEVRGDHFKEIVNGLER